MSKKIDPISMKRQFPMLAGRKSLAYMDSAASSQTPKAVIESINGYYRKYRANVHRGLYLASEQATDRYEEARAKLARMLGADSQEIVFTRGTTESLNLLAYTLSADLGPGDEVAMTVMEHHSSLLPWQQLAKRQGFSVKFIGLTKDSQLDMKAARHVLSSGRVRLLSLVHVSNSLGTVVPVADLAQLAKRAGARVIVDGAQSVGHRPVDVRELGCDFLALSGHKIFGPTGIGALYGRKELLEAMPPFHYGGDMISHVSFDDAEWNELPWKFEAGTPNIAGGIGLGAAVDFIEELGLANIHRHETEITAYAMRKLARVKGVEIYGPPLEEDRGGLVSFGIKGVHPHDLTGILGGRGLCLRGGHHCTMPLMRLLDLPGTTRASFSVFNDRSEVDRLVEEIKNVKHIFGV